MRIGFIVAAMIAVGATNAAAQAAAPTDRFSWSMSEPQFIAQEFRYEVAFDGGSYVTLPGHTCVVGPPMTCSAPIPAITPTTHTVLLRAVSIGGTPINGPASDPLTFTMRAVPSRPGLFTIVPGEEE